MKICFLLNNLELGGAERVITILSEYLANHDCEVSIVVLNKLNNQQVLNPSIKIISLNQSKVLSSLIPLRNLLKKNKYDFIHSMEFLYYLKNPLEMLKIFFTDWLNDEGILIAGVDHYLENTASHDWPESLNVHMTTLSESEWKQGMVEAGFTEVKVRKVGLKPGFTGTLAISGKKPQSN